MKAVLCWCALLAMASVAVADKKSGRGVMSLDVDAGGDRIDLLIVRADEGSPKRLEHLRSNDGGATWTDPVAVGVGQPEPKPAHRGQDAQLASAGDNLVAIWTIGSESRFGRGPLAAARSSDGGKTWQAASVPSDDGQPTDHAFIDLLADANGTFHCVWLDARGPEGKGLRYARSIDGGMSWSKNLTLDAETCECCWNRINVAPNGDLYVFYRDRSPRDMAIIRSADDGQAWSKPVTVGSFNWTIDGCPHVGGALAFGRSPGELHATVWTARGDGAKGAYVLSSFDHGQTWSSPMQLGDASSWRPDIASNKGRLMAVWDAYVEGGVAVLASASWDTGKSWSPAVRLNSAESSANVPRIVAAGGGFRVFWTEMVGSGQAIWRSKLLP